MGWDFPEETVRVLTDGLPGPPTAAVPGLTFPAAAHRGEYFGAVLFLRLRRDGYWDSDTAITRREGTGWAFPSSCSGGGWANPFERPLDGWSAGPLLLCGGTGGGMDDEQGVFRSATAVDGLAARSVAAIEYEIRGRTFTYPIESPLGAFVIVVEGEDQPSLNAHLQGASPFDSE